MAVIPGVFLADFLKSAADNHNIPDFLLQVNCFFSFFGLQGQWQHSLDTFVCTVTAMQIFYFVLHLLEIDFWSIEIVLNVMNSNERRNDWPLAITKKGLHFGPPCLNMKRIHTHIPLLFC